jgi:hypothetical protein
MEHLFFKDGEYEAIGGIYIRNDLKKFFQTLIEKGLNPVGIKVDDESFNLEVIVERNKAYKELYEKNTAEKQ